jgi:quercetin dioxygenase-like cupin family protein
MAPNQSLLPTVRRLVTGPDADGQSVIVLDDEPPSTEVGVGERARRVVKVWATTLEGVGQTREPAPSSGSLGPNATEIRVVDMPPGARREMHRTETIDYGIVVKGEVYLLLQRGEKLLRCGDIVIQRRTMHAWENRSGAVARLVFVNMSGQITDTARCPASADEA